MAEPTSHGTDDSMARLRSDFDTFAEKVLSKLNNVCAGITTVQQDIRAINTTLAELQHSAEDTPARLTEIEQIKLPKVEKEGKEAEERLRDALTAMELHDRKQNLLFYKIAPTTGDNTPQKAAAEIRDAITKLGYSPEKAEAIPMVHAHRVPRKQQHREPNVPSTPDPIIVRFASMFDRDAILKAYDATQRQLPAGTTLPFTIRTDLPPGLTAKRYRLEKIAYEQPQAITISVGKTKVVTSPNYPSDYTNSAHLTWLIQSPQNESIVLSFDDFDLEPGYDVLKVGFGNVSGLEETRLITLSGSALPSDVNCRHSEAWLEFISDSEVVRRGFLVNISAKVETVDYEGQGSCNVTWPWHYVEFPGYPSSGSLNTMISHVIEAPPECVVRIYVESRAGDYGRDLLVVGDGKEVGRRDSILDTFTGDISLRLYEIESISRWMWFMLVSDHVEPATRFDVVFIFATVSESQTIWDSQNFPVTDPLAISHCNRIWIELDTDTTEIGQGFKLELTALTAPVVLIEDGVEELVSPYYPLPYQNDEYIEWKVTTSQDLGIMGHFVTFDLIDKDDTLVIGKGSFPNVSESIISELTGRILPSDFVLWTHKAWIRFSTGTSGISGGFKLELRSINGEGRCLIPLGMEAGWIPDSSITATSQKDEDHTPNQARLHGPASWIPHPQRENSVIVVTFDDPHYITGLIIQGGEEIQTPWLLTLTVSFPDGSEEDVESIIGHNDGHIVLSDPVSEEVKFDPTDIPHVFISSSHKLSIKIFTGLMTSSLHITAAYGDIDKGRCTTREVATVDSRFICTDASGLIMTPNYFENYPPDIHHTWLITTKLWTHTHLLFIHFNVVSLDSRCNEDHVIVSDASSFQTMGRYCDHNRPNGVITSSYNRMTVEFYSDSMESGSGLLGEFSSSQLRPDVITEAEVENGPSAATFQCYDGSLHPGKIHCDGIIDCIGNTKEDEENCLYSQDDFSCDPTHEVKCGDGACTSVQSVCIYDIDQFGLMEGCRDATHLRDCHDFPCPPSTMKCAEAYCIPLRFRCNGKMDCPYGEDETGCVANETSAKGLAPSLMPYIAVLNMEASGVNEILPDSFQENANLLILNLAENAISFLSSGSFAGLGQLKILNLSGNPIDIIETGAFNNLSSLQEIDLRGTNIKVSATSRQSMFQGIENLQVIHADKYLFCCLLGLTDQDGCKAPRDQFSSCEDLMSNAILRAFIWILGSSAFVGNAFVVGYRLYQAIYGQGKTVQASLITHLAISDLLMGTYMITIASADFHYRGNYAVYADAWQSSVICKMAGMISLVSSEASVFLIMVISLDRCLHVVAPFKRSLHFSPRGAHIVEFIIWFVAGTLGLLPLCIPWFIEGNFYGQSGVCLALPLTADRPSGWAYSISLFIGANFVAFLVTLLCYVAIFVFFQLSKRRILKRGKGSKEEKRLAEEIKLASKMALIVGTDLICWMPVVIMGLMSAAGKLVISSQVYAWTAVFILPVNSSLNPYLYTLSSLQNKKRQLRSSNNQSDDSKINTSIFDAGTSSLITPFTSLTYPEPTRIQGWMQRNSRDLTPEELQILSRDILQAVASMSKSGFQTARFLNLDSIAVQTNEKGHIERAFIVLDAPLMALHCKRENGEDIEEKRDNRQLDIKRILSRAQTMYAQDS
ncbi:uncharacterized protein [Diadema setosum]|uniref:uncharacterized protein n=1 Tax=Diadema setosum TaxID=31175 RepID=UPI003B3AE3BD